MTQALLRCLPPALAVFLLPAPFALAAPSPEKALTEAEATLLSDPPRALELATQAVEALPEEATVDWRGDRLAVGELRDQLDAFTAAWAATDTRRSFAAYCLDNLIGVDRIGMALYLARRLIRDGEKEAALALADREELAGHVRVQVLAALKGAAGKGEQDDRREAKTAELLRIYQNTDSHSREEIRMEIADGFARGGDYTDLAAFAEEFPGWARKYNLLRAAAAFPDWDREALLGQAVVLAREEEPGERAMALARLSSAALKAGLPEHARTLRQAAEESAREATARDKAIAFGALASLAARQGEKEAAKVHLASALRTLLNETHDWRQTDGFIDLCQLLADSPAAAIAGPRLEEFSALLATTAEEGGSRNKYRVYEFRGAAMAASPSGDFSTKERAALFEELLRLAAMHEEEVHE